MKYVATVITTLWVSLTYVATWFHWEGDWIAIFIAIVPLVILWGFAFSE